MKFQSLQSRTKAVCECPGGRNRKGKELACKGTSKAVAYADHSDLETEWANELGAIEYVWLMGLITEQEYLAVLGAVFSEIARDRGRDAVWADETVAEFYYFSVQLSSLKRRKMP